MRGVTVSLEDVQRDLLELISCETVLCGHSLENDLRRLQMMHPTCVDTVLLYPHDKGPPYRTKLSSLKSFSSCSDQWPLPQYLVLPSNLAGNARG